VISHVIKQKFWLLMAYLPSVAHKTGGQNMYMNQNKSDVATKTTGAEVGGFVPFVLRHISKSSSLLKSFAFDRQINV